MLSTTQRVWTPFTTISTGAEETSTCSTLPSARWKRSLAVRALPSFWHSSTTGQQISVCAQGLSRPWLER